MVNLKEVPVTDLKGIGDKSATLLKKLDINSIRDLLEYYPKDYLKMPELSLVSELVTGKICAVKAKVRGDFYQRKTTRMTVSTVSVSDGTGILNLVFFRQDYLRKILTVNSEFVFLGRVSSRGASLFMEMPEIIKFDCYERRLKSLNPVYSLTKGISSKVLSKFIDSALSQYVPVEDILDEELIRKYDLLPMGQSLRYVHFPVDTNQFLIARRNIVFREFFDFFTTLNLNRTERVESEHVLIPSAVTSRFIESLPYELTKGQLEAWNECNDDMSGGFVMNRLIQGDVGCGKTVVAFLCLLQCAANKKQSLIMAPIEVLAMQHFETFKKFLSDRDMPFKICLLTGNVKGKARKDILNGIKTGEYDIVVGTHALFQEQVEYNNLALAIIDEQHRFGVEQRDSFLNKGNKPHILTMSATPIPRTLACALYGNISISNIKELPGNRIPIKSCVIGRDKRNSAYSFMEKEIKSGHQCYCIVPMIEESESSELENVIDYTQKLKDSLPPNIRIDFLHGRMKNDLKNEIMDRFAHGETDILVSTTVIEVGINVPNATVILIENADRFGLSQLHQLRGRVGRGEYTSYCVFINGSEEDNERLEVLIKSNDGFYISEEDLRLRGPGDLCGIRQSGEMRFKMADIFKDADILFEAKKEADERYTI